MVVEWTLCAGSGTVYLSLGAFWCLSSLVADFSPFDKVPAPRCHCFHFKGKKNGSEKLFRITWQFPPCSLLWEDFFATSLWLGSWRGGGQGLGRDSAREPFAQADVCVFAIFHPRFLTAVSKDGIVNFVNQSPAVLDNSMRNMAAENVSYKMLTLGKLNERYTETLCPWQLFCKYHAYCCLVVSDSLWALRPLSTGFPRQVYWSGSPFPSPEDLPSPGIEPTSPKLAGGFFSTEPPGKPKSHIISK